MSKTAEKRTRKEWAHAFGVEYQVMANALRSVTKGRRIPNHTYDEDTARDALVKYYGDQRMKHLMRAQRIEQRMQEVRDKEVSR